MVASWGEALTPTFPPSPPSPVRKKWLKSAIFGKFLDFCPLRNAFLSPPYPPTKTISGGTTDHNSQLKSIENIVTVTHRNLENNCSYHFDLHCPRFLVGTFSATFDQGISLKSLLSSPINSCTAPCNCCISSSLQGPTAEVIRIPQLRGHNWVPSAHMP